MRPPTGVKEVHMWRFQHQSMLKPSLRCKKEEVEPRGSVEGYVFFLEGTMGQGLNQISHSLCKLCCTRIKCERKTFDSVSWS